MIKLKPRSYYYYRQGDRSWALFLKNIQYGNLRSIIVLPDI